MSAAASVYQIALPAPLHRLFDYLPPENAPSPVIGARVRVPFGPRRLAVGVVLGTAAKSALPAGVLGARGRVPFGPRRLAVGVVLGTAAKSALPRAKLKRIHEVLDAGPLLTDSQLA